MVLIIPRVRYGLAQSNCRSHCQGEESPLHAVAQNNVGSDLPAYHYDPYNYGMHMIFLA